MPVERFAVISSSYESERVITNQLIKSVFIASMGGLMLGYDIALTGGLVLDNSFLTRFFPPSVHRKAPGRDGNAYCRPDSPTLTLFTSSTYLLAMFASLFASAVTTIHGRKSSMAIGGVAFFVGSMLGCFAQNMAMFVTGRVFAGVGVGFALQSAPLYISEVAPTIYRGAFNFFFQMAITIGIILGFTNFIFGWRSAIGIGMVPAAVLAYGTIHMTDTPISLLQRGYSDAANRALEKVRDHGACTEFAFLRNVARPAECPWQDILQRRRYRPQLVLCVLVPLFHQLVSVNAIRFCAFYAALVFKRMGYGNGAQIVSLSMNGLVSLLATMIAIFSVDRGGRRRLFLRGGIQMTTCLLSMGIAIGIIFGVSGVGSMDNTRLILLLVLIWGYIAAFAVSWGPLGWLVPGEVCPREIRSEGQALSVMVSMISAFVAAQSFAPALCHMKYGILIILAASGVVMTVLAHLFLPEANHVHIENMDTVWRDHWYWKRYFDTGDGDPEAENTGGGRGDDGN